MGELIPIDGGAPQKKSAPTDGQALFGAVIDTATANGWQWPRSQIAIAVKHGAASLKDGIDPDVVLAGCVVALRRGQPHLATKIILDASNKRSGAYISREDYWQALDETPVADLKRQAEERERRIREHDQRLMLGEGDTP